MNSVSILACFSASTEDDEEWGWGDDDDDDDDIEMTPSFATDTNLHNRRPSNDQSPFQKHLPKRSPRKPSPITQRTPMDSLLEMPNIPPTHPTPSTAPVAGLTVKKTGMSLGGAPKATSTPVPMSAGVPPKASSQGNTGFNPETVPTSIGGNPLQITNLGKKKPAAAPVKKAPAPAPEDDIFASMGLAAKPTFSHAPAPTTRRAPSSSSSSRWATTPSTSAPVTKPSSTFGGSIQGATTMAAASSNLTTSGGLTATSSGGDDDADWDDADLDDLLDI